MKNRQRKRQEQPSLFTPNVLLRSSDGSHVTAHASRALPIPPDYHDTQKIKDEIELFGFPLSKHPLELYQDALQGYKFVFASEMHKYAGRMVRMVGWLITEKFAETHDGQPMEFTTFEDLTGLYDATFFPTTFQKYGQLLTGGKPYLVEGLVEEDFGECTLTVHQLTLLGPHQQPRITTHPSSAK